MDKSRIHNRWPVAREGLPFIIAAWGLTFFSLYVGLFFPTAVLALVALFVTYFFRDPERAQELPEDGVVSPADGRILEISRVGPGEKSPLEAPSEKVSIFMSVFNVHVNRMPVQGTIQRIRYSPGKFFAANLDKASEQNEKNTILLDLPDMKKVALIQIAGLIARRIACWVSEGDPVEAGQRFGLIRFGSRVEIFLPEGSRIVVRPGQHVKAGETIIGYLH
jgi:phosphatidylserine decarboxylase